MKGGKGRRRMEGLGPGEVRWREEEGGKKRREERKKERGKDRKREAEREKLKEEL